MPNVTNEAASINAPTIESAGSIVNVGGSAPAPSQSPITVVDAINAASRASLGTPLTPIR